MTAKKHSLLYRGVLLQVTLVASRGDMIIVAWEQQQPFNGLFSRITWVSRYQKRKTNLDFTGATDSEWQWHQLGHMQVCTSLQTDNHANTPPLVFYRPGALPAAQPTASKHWRHGKLLTANKLLLLLLHLFNVSRFQKGKTSLDLNEARDGVFGLQWHQLDHMQTVCT